MPIDVSCTCGRQLRARDELAGKTCKCPGCGALLTVPEAGDFDLYDELTAMANASMGPVSTEEPPLARVAEAPAPPSLPPPLPEVEPAAPSRTVARPIPQFDPRQFVLRRTYWLLLLLVAPLAYSTIAGPAVTLEQQLAETIKEHPDLESTITAVEKGEGDIDDLFALLPGQRLAGALLGRRSWAHWSYALVAGVIFVGVILLASPGEAYAGEVETLHLVAAGVFTGTAGVLALIAIQIIGLFTCIIGALYLAADDPRAPFGASLLGFVMGVGFLEESIKLIPVMWRIYRLPAITWRGACVWGMGSGAGFGVSEGIHYASNYYNGVATAEEYLLRFTSVAALHVLLSGSCAILIHRHRKHLDAEQDWMNWLLTLGAIITVPMLLHGLYNTLLKKDYELQALLIWLICFAWLAYLIESSHKRDLNPKDAPKRARYIQTPNGLRMLQD